MISGDGRTISYTPFDKPKVITKSGGYNTTISYGPSRSRYKRVDQTNTGTTTYTYAGGIYEKVQLPNNQVEERHTVGDFTIVTIKNRTSSSAGTTETHYLHKDHLGSITVITNESAQIVEEFSFDPWGKRRAPNLAKLIAELGSWETLTTFEKNNQTIAPLTLTSTITTRGFTGHEQLDPVGLIHMNGRVYEAEIGRFISADPFIQDRTNLQALNRYSYVQNNPLSHTDPSGFFLKKLFKKLAKAIAAPIKALEKLHKRVRRSIMRAIGKVPGLSEVISAGLYVVCGPVCTITFNASMADAHGASPGEILKGAAIGFVTSFTGKYFGQHMGFGQKMVFGQPIDLGSFAGQSITSGIAAKAQGGKFIDGVKASAISWGASSLVNKYFSWVSDSGSETAESTSGDVDESVTKKREVALEGLQEAREKTRLDKESREYGGLIYRNADGSYGYTKDLIRGLPAEQCEYGVGCVDVFAALDQVPEGAHVVGSFHSHPNNAVDRIFGRFSPADIRVAQGANPFRGSLDSYVITPNGYVDEYDRFLKSISTIWPRD